MCTDSVLWFNVLPRVKIKPCQETLWCSQNSCMSCHLLDVLNSKHITETWVHAVLMGDPSEFPAAETLLSSSGHCDMQDQNKLQIMTRNIYLGFSYLIGGLIQLHLLKQRSYVLWCCRSSFWKQHSEFLHKFLSFREKQYQNQKQVYW